ncbi:MAG: TrkA family potassium uptake protein [Desulfurococcales archaeon]|nr:TrkA family potassium uptake protein [Desulfurococcales archaeon]
MRILVIGAGGVGGEVAKRLSDAGHSVTVVDLNEERILALSSEADVEGIVRDATDPSLYDEIDLSSYDVVIAATDRDEVNLFVSSLAKLYGVSRILVRVRKPQTVKLLHMLGIDAIVSEHQIAANLIYSFIEGRYGLVELIPVLSGDFIVVSATVGPTSPIRGKRVSEAKKMLPGGTTILMVYHDGDFIDPSELGVIDEGMILIMLARRDQAEEVAKLF